MYLVKLAGYLYWLGQLHNSIETLTCIVPSLSGILQLGVIYSLN